MEAEFLSRIDNLSGERGPIRCDMLVDASAGAPISCIGW